MMAATKTTAALMLIKQTDGAASDEDNLVGGNSDDLS